MEAPAPSPIHTNSGLTDSWMGEMEAPAPSPIHTNSGLADSWLAGMPTSSSVPHGGTVIDVPGSPTPPTLLDSTTAFREGLNAPAGISVHSDPHGTTYKNDAGYLTDSNGQPR
jgi:hypothetical protein